MRIKEFLETQKESQQLVALYETIYIVKQDLDNKALKDLEKKYENLLKLNKAIIEYKENWGLRNLAYKIRKNHIGD